MYPKPFEVGDFVRPRVRLNWIGVVVHCRPAIVVIFRCLPSMRLIVWPFDEDVASRVLEPFAMKAPRIPRADDFDELCNSAIRAQAVDVETEKQRVLTEK